MNASPSINPVDPLVERAYNPRVTVADTPAILERWIASSQATRVENPGFTTLRYGTHPRECYDLFPAKNPRGMLIYIHGGYWRMLSKDEHSFIAKALVPMGYSAITLNYPLCPEVRVGDIANAIFRAILAILPTLAPEERDHLVLAGHSAGGYLTAAMLARNWQAAGLKATPFRAALAISGVFNLEPLLQTSMNALIQLDEAQVQALALPIITHQPHPPLLLAVGSEETPEFHAQSHTLAQRWSLAPEAVISIAGCNHFTVIEALANPDTPLFGQLLSLFTERD